MKLCTALLLALIALQPALAGDKVKDKAKVKDAKDKDKKPKETILGVWNVVSLSVDGAKPSSKGGAGATVSITADTFTIRAPDGKADPASLKFDLEKKQIDIAHRGAGKTETMHGVFELAGDSLKICFGLPSLDKGVRVSVRPASLEPGTDRFLLILRKSK